MAASTTLVNLGEMTAEQMVTGGAASMGPPLDFATPDPCAAELKRGALENCLKPWLRLKIVCWIDIGNADSDAVRVGP